MAALRRWTLTFSCSGEVMRAPDTPYVFSGFPGMDIMKGVLQKCCYCTLRRVALALDAGLAREVSSKLQQYILQRTSQATASQGGLTPAQLEAAARMYALEVTPT